MAYRPAIVGALRVNNARLGYEPASLVPLRRARVRILIAGVEAGSRVRVGSLTIRDVLNDAPNTCSLTVDTTAPTVAQALRVLVNSDTPVVLFTGTIQTVDQTYEGLPAQRCYHCTAIDDLARANRRRPFGAWTNVSATTIAQALIASFAPGLTATHVQAGLPAISVVLDGSEGMSGALRQIATLIGGYFYVEDLDLHLFQVEATNSPDTIDSTPGRFLDDPPITASTDLSQVRTRVYGKGHGEALLTDVAIGETMLPIADVVLFNPVGGHAIAFSQVITYSGVQIGGLGSMVGPGVSPSVAPSVAGAAGSGLGTGTYGYAYTDVTAAGESLPSPVGSLAVGLTAAPLTAPVTGSPNTGAGVDVGSHDYAVTFGTATGETTPGPTVAAVVTTGPATPPVAPTYIQSFAGTTLVGTYDWACTFVTVNGETLPSARLTITTGSVAAIGVTLPIGPAGTTGRKLYRTVAGGAQLKLVYTSPDNTGLGYNDGVADGSLGANAPTADTTALAQVPLTAIPIGGVTVTSRKLYRRFNGAGTFKLVTTLADNTTTTYTDSVANGSLGAAAPSSNTATANQVSVTGIALGPATTTSRKLYRTVVNGAQLKLLATLADNTTTTYTDSVADGSLGANVPTSDTSGLTQPSGQVNAGSTSLLTASAGPFASGGGWAILGSQAIRYTGISGNTLTGIPAAGIGALLNTVRYGEHVDTPPALTGVTGIGVAILKGTPVNLWVQRDSLAAQAVMAYVDGGDGIYEHLLSDERRGEASLLALCDADLALFSAPIVTVTYATRDLKTKSGKTIAVHLTSPDIYQTLTIQDVTISEINTSPVCGPRLTVTASSVRFSLDDLLRQLLGASA